jgi:DNA processing protein
MELDAAIAAARAAERTHSLSPVDRPHFSGAVQALGVQDSAYPSGLLRLGHPPPALFVRGPASALPDRSRCVAVIGSRRASPEGLRSASDLGVGLAREGLCVVSGLALGIDAAAHQGALDGGGDTLAVLASPVDEPSPRRNHGLAERILRQGGWLVSERPPGAGVQPWEFPRRNRLVAAQVSLVVVVEAGLRSGTLSTVEHALGLGIDVAAVPGPATRPACRGSNALLRRGAHWVESVGDVLTCLGRQAAAGRRGGPHDAEERAVLDGLPDRSGSPGRWLAGSALPPAVARRALARLVSRGILRRLPGGRIGRVL